MGGRRWRGSGGERQSRCSDAVPAVGANGFQYHHVIENTVIIYNVQLRYLTMQCIMSWLSASADV